MLDLMSRMTLLPETVQYEYASFNHVHTASHAQFQVTKCSTTRHCESIVNDTIHFISFHSIHKKQVDSLSICIF